MAIECAKYIKNRRRTENWTFISNSFFCVDLHWMERGRASLATGQFRAYYCHYPFLEGKQLLLVLQPKINGVKSGSARGQI